MKLSKREEFVIRELNEEKTIYQIAKENKTTTERVKYVEEKAMNKINHIILEENMLKIEDFEKEQNV